MAEQPPTEIKSSVPIVSAFSLRHEMFKVAQVTCSSHSLSMEDTF